MPFVLRPSRQFPVHCLVMDNAGPIQAAARCESLVHLLATLR